MNIIPIDLFKELLNFFETKRYFQYQIFLTLIYLWVIGNTLLLLPGHENFWGDFDRFIPHKYLGNASYFEKSLNLLFLSVFEKKYLIFIALQILFSFFAIFKIYPKLSAFIVWFLTINLDNKIYVTTDGGNNLIQLLLFYCIFIVDLNSQKNNVFYRYVGIVSYVTCRFQICLMYFMAGLTKITGNFWTKGLGLYYAMTVDEYSHPILVQLVSSYPFVSVAGSYVTLFFQISFPFLIWVRKLRPIYFIVGSFIHLGISFGMGLLSFGLAMMVAYSAFYTEEQAKSIAKSVSSLLSIFNRRLKNGVKKLA